jgi:maltose alpha-D-glucosyltransferase/alpha-amylase
MGKLRFVNPPNRKVMAFVRIVPEETLLCVCNLARGAQPAELDLSSWQGWTPIELFAETVFPPITDRSYQLSLGAYGVYWFRLQPPDGGSAS